MGVFVILVFVNFFQVNQFQLLILNQFWGSLVLGISIFFGFGLGVEFMVVVLMIFMVLYLVLGVIGFFLILLGFVMMNMVGSVGIFLFVVQVIGIINFFFFQCLVWDLFRVFVLEDVEQGFLFVGWDLRVWGLGVLGFFSFSFVMKGLFLQF